MAPSRDAAEAAARTEESKDHENETEWCNEDYLSLVIEQAPSVFRDESGISNDLDEQAQALADEVANSTAPLFQWNPQAPPPWLERGYNDRSTKQIHPLTFLHNEMVAFLHLMEPLPSEIEQRERLVERIRQAVQRSFDVGTRLEVFGSQATGLFLPTSDIDLVVMTPNPENGSAKTAETEDTNAANENNYKDESAAKSPLHCFMEMMQQTEWLNDLSYLEAVEHTRIPLVKFTMAATGISVDVSFNQPTGPPAAELMKRYLDALPPLRPLTIVLKYFLAARSLNEPYSGGVGSFMLQLMIVAFLQQRERDAVNFARPSAYNLGALLLDFLELYGLDLNYYTTGISVRYDGFFFPKGAADRRATFWKPDRMAMMALENPLDPTLDVGQSSFRYQTVQRAFAVAYRMLLSFVTSEPHEMQHITSILATILPPTHYMTSRLVLKRRDRPLSAKRQGQPSSAEKPRKRDRNPSSDDRSGKRGRKR
jgi:non-canonical poly(A) RNA polymerase PAPD5/7